MVYGSFALFGVSAIKTIRLHGISSSRRFFNKHLRHPDAPGGIENFDIKVMSVHKKPLTRQKTEAVKIATSTATNLLNSKAEHRQPALLRVRMVQGNDNEVQGPGRGAGAGQGAGGGEGGEQAGHQGRRRRRGE